MARVAFIQDEIRTRQGIMILSAVLKKYGHFTDVFATDESHEKILDQMRSFDPHIVAFSTSTPMQRSALDFAYNLRETNKEVFIVMGGPHPTFYPQVLEENKCLDAVCVGEGEYALLELAENISDRDKVIKVRNLWVRDGDRICKNGLQPLIENLDDLPDPDHEVYFNKFPLLANSDTKIFMVGRGCPFPCTYCFNKKYMDMYKSKGTYIRFKSIPKIINEIKNMKKNYPIKWIQFNDDTFNINREWLDAFLDEYTKEIGIGFLCNLRVDRVDEDLVKKLKAAGVDRVGVGVEHGDEEFRKRVLKRTITNQQIVNAGNWFNKYKIRLHTDNIIGFPGETVDMAFETIRINQKIKPEQAGCGVLQPFPGTEIYEYAAKNGLLKKNITIDDFKAQRSWTSGQPRVFSLIEQENMNELINLHCFFDLLVHHPWLEGLCRILIKLPPNRFYVFISQWGMFKVYWKYAHDFNERLKLLKRAFSILWKR